MSEHFFGVGCKGVVTDEQGERISAIAEEHGASFTWATMPGDGPKYWFACPNRGEPFDSRTARDVWAALEAAGEANADGLILESGEDEVQS